MRDIREDLKERVASITAELEELKKREHLLSSIQQSVFGLLEEEDRRFRDRVPSLNELMPKGIFSETTPNGIYGAERSKPVSTELYKNGKSADRIMVGW